MNPLKSKISARLVEFGQSRHGSEWGWKAKFAEALKMSPGSLQLYITGKRTPAAEVQERLRLMGCDIEWLMTGKSKGTEIAPKVTEERRILDRISFKMESMSEEQRDKFRLLLNTLDKEKPENIERILEIIDLVLRKPPK